MGVKAEADAELLELDFDIVVVVLTHRHRELAAGEKAGGLPGQGGQVRLGQDIDQALALESVDDAVDTDVTVAVAARQRVGDPARIRGPQERQAAGAGIRPAGGEAEQKIAWREDAFPIDAEELGNLARHFGHPNTQVDLVGDATAMRLISVSFSPRYLLAISRSFLRLHRIANGALEDDAAVDRAYLEASVRGHLVQYPLQARQLVLDDELTAQEHALVGVHGEQRGRAAAPPEHVDQRGRVRLHVGELGVGDEDGSGRTLQPDQLTFVHLEHHLAGSRYGVLRQGRFGAGDQQKCRQAKSRS